MTDWRVQEAQNEARFRVQNEWTSQTSGVYDGPTRRATFVCECSDGDCTDPIELTEHEYEQVRSHSTHFAVVRDHENPESEVVLRVTPRFSVVSKIFGAAMQVARDSDPRSDTIRPIEEP